MSASPLDQREGGREGERERAASAREAERRESEGKGGNDKEGLRCLRQSQTGHEGQQMSAMSPDQAADVELAAASGCQRHGTVATEPSN